MLFLTTFILPKGAEWRFRSPATERLQLDRGQLLHACKLLPRDQTADHAAVQETGKAVNCSHTCALVYIVNQSDQSGFQQNKLSCEIIYRPHK